MCEVFERRFSLINSSHRYSTQPNYRSTPNYPTKTKARVPLPLFVALRLFSRADSRSGVHITCFSQKNKMCWIKYNLAKNVLDQSFSQKCIHSLDRRTFSSLFLPSERRTTTSASDESQGGPPAPPDGGPVPQRLRHVLLEPPREPAGPHQRRFPR